MIQLDISINHTTTTVQFCVLDGAKNLELNGPMNSEVHRLTRAMRNVTTLIKNITDRIDKHSELIDQLEIWRGKDILLLDP